MWSQLVCRTRSLEPSVAPSHSQKPLAPLGTVASHCRSLRWSRRPLGSHAAVCRHPRQRYVCCTGRAALALCCLLGLAGLAHVPSSRRVRPSAHGCSAAGGGAAWLWHSVWQTNGGWLQVEAITLCPLAHSQKPAMGWGGARQTSRVGSSLGRSCPPQSSMERTARSGRHDLVARSVGIGLPRALRVAASGLPPRDAPDRRAHQHRHQQEAQPPSRLRAAASGTASRPHRLPRVETKRGRPRCATCLQYYRRRGPRLRPAASSQPTAR